MPSSSDSKFDMLLPTIIQRHRQQALLILQSSLCQSALPILREVVRQNATDEQKQTLLFCFLHPPSCIYDAPSETQNVAVHDHSEHIHVVIDSVNTILSDIGSPAETFKFIRDLKELVVSRSIDSHLTLHIQAPSPLLPFLIQTSFSSSLNHLIVHPPALLHYLATEYLSPPPPASPEAKFWGIFIPVSERISDVIRIVYGNGGEGSGGSEELIVEVVKAVERVLEGWDIKRSSAVELAEMSSLKASLGQPTATAPNPAQNLSFNLNLTTSQQEARAQVPLPYAHEGKPAEAQTPAAILYDPDSGDDIDDDDPDEDLDI
ncbi:hypothetical protein BDZ89DRAFT_1099617 [Hymenopellis radicata]|nr:hypothetical protein BDZ89DRAFT_1099617 [Hymenopellis radicata]